LASEHPLQAAPQSLAIGSSASRRKEAETPLDGREQRFRTLLDNSPNLIFLKDVQGRYLFVNKQFQRVFHINQEQIEGKKDEEVFPAEQAAAFRTNDLLVLQNGVSMEFEEVALHDDGPHTSIVQKFPVCDESGKLYAIGGIVTDITERKRAEEALRRSEERFRLSIEGIKDYAIIMLSPDGRVMTWNKGAERIKGYLPQEILGQHFALFYEQAAVQLGKPERILREAAATGRFEDEGWQIRKDGSRYWAHMVITALTDERGTPKGFAKVTRDLTDRKRAEETLKEAFDEIQILKNQLAQEKLYLEEEIRTERGFEEIIGESAALKRILKQVETVAPTDSSVLIHGETGTGKERIAIAIHSLSARRDRTFVKLNCAAIPLGLLESELFGHEKGAFTGAIAQRIGRFELAHKGTLFLDEIGDIPLELQPKLLRVLQDQEFERLGSTRTQRVDVRLVAATNRDLAPMIADKQFRSDLFYRLNVFPIRVPPLRDRPEDIPPLVRHFVSTYARRMNKRIDSISAGDMDALARYPWPGNVRELQNFIERAVILSPDGVLRIPPGELTHTAEQPSTADRTLRDAEREHILGALEETRWVLGGPKGAATRLGLKRTTLRYKMDRLGIRRPQ